MAAKEKIMQNETLRSLLNKDPQQWTLSDVLAYRREYEKTFNLSKEQSASLFDTHWKDDKIGTQIARGLLYGGDDRPNGDLPYADIIPTVVEGVNTSHLLQSDRVRDTPGLSSIMNWVNTDGGDLVQSFIPGQGAGPGAYGESQRAGDAFSDILARYNDLPRAERDAAALKDWKENAGVGDISRLREFSPESERSNPFGRISNSVYGLLNPSMRDSITDFNNGDLTYAQLNLLKKNPEMRDQLIEEFLKQNMTFDPIIDHYEGNVAYDKDGNEVPILASNGGNLTASRRAPGRFNNKPYSPNVGYGDALTMALSDRPGRAARQIATREGVRYGVSNLGDNFYSNGSFTNLGAGASGALAGGVGGLLNGDDAGEIGKKVGIGFASNYAGNAASDYAVSQGMSSVGAGALGGFAGSAVGLLGSALTGHSVKYQVGPAFASGMGNVVGGPILGAVLGRLTAMGTTPPPPQLYEDLTYSGGTGWDSGKYDQGRQLVFKDGKWVPNEITSYQSVTVPQKYWGKFIDRHNQINQDLAHRLNSMNIDYSDPDARDRIMSYLSRLKGQFAVYRTPDYVKDFASGTSWGKNFQDKYSGGRGKYNPFSEAISGLASGSHVMTNQGPMSIKDYLYENKYNTGAEDGADTPSLVGGIKNALGTVNWNLPPELDYRGNPIEEPGVGEE